MSGRKKGPKKKDEHEPTESEWSSQARRFSIKEDDNDAVEEPVQRRLSDPTDRDPKQSNTEDISSFKKLIAKKKQRSCMLSHMKTCWYLSFHILIIPLKI